MATILVTGSTGTVGSRLVKALAGRGGVTVRAATRNPAKQAPPAANVQYVPFELDNKESVAAAVKGVDKVFSLIHSTPQLVDQAKGLYAAARAADVKHIVELSGEFVTTAPQIPFGKWHAEAEKLLEASGIANTVLRPGLFMTDFFTFFAPQPDGNIYLPVGQSSIAAIDPVDLAEVAAITLTQDGHVGKRYHLTGGEALTVPQIAAKISEASGRQINHVDVPPEAVRAGMEKMGAPAWLIDATLTMLAVVKDGKTAGISNAVRELTGHAPRSYAQFARDNAAAWKK